MAQEDNAGLRPLVSLIKRLFGGGSAAPTTPAATYASAPPLVISEENRAELLHLARHAPFAYGYWLQVKRLYKAAEGAGEWDIVNALAARLDTTPFPEKPAMLPTPLSQANITGINRILVSGTLMYLLNHGGSNSGLHVVDISDPVQPRPIGYLAIPGPLDIALDGDRAYVVERGQHYNATGALHVVDISDPARLQSLARIEQNYPMRVALLGQFVLMLSNYYRDSGLTILDFTNPQAPVKVSYTKFNTPSTLAVAGPNVYVLCGEVYNNRQNIFTFDLSDPLKPRQSNSLSAPNVTDIAVSDGYLYATTGRMNSYQRATAKEGLAIYELLEGGIPAKDPVILEIGTARSVAIRDRYAYVGVEGPGYNDFKKGGLRIVDIAAPLRPQLIGEFKGGTVSRIAASTEDNAHLYFAMQTRTYQPLDFYALDLSRPAQPFLLGSMPSNKTFGYMKRRARRALRTLAEQDPAQYVYQATQLLLATGKDRQEIDTRVQWLSMDILFGNSRRYEQTGHGRGAYLQRGNHLSLRTREERHPELWDRHPLLAESLYTLAELPWQTHETACKMLRGMKRSLPTVPDTTLIRFLQSPAPLLIAVASRAIAAKLAQNETVPADLAAEVFFKGSRRARTTVREYIARQANVSSRWGNPFANRLYKLASENIQNGRLTRRQSLSFAYLVAHFPAVLSRQVAPELAVMLYATRRPELREWGLATLRQAAVGQFNVWLQALESLPEDLRAPALAALSESVPSKAFSDKMLSTLVYHASAWMRAVAWDLIAASQTPDATLIKLWDELLGITQETDALRTATASPAAITLFNRLSLDGARLQNLLETRPFLVGLLPQSALQNIVRVLPPASILGLVQSATDTQWPDLRTTIANALAQSGQIPAFWRQAWERIGATGDASLIARLLSDDVLSATFLTIDDPDYLNTSNPIYGPILGRWVRAHDSLFVADSAPLLQIATHSLPDIRAFGLERVRQVGMQMPFALRLLEAELPPSMALGKEFFEAVPSGDIREIEFITALCDSPKAPVRAYGRQYLEARWEHVAHEQVFNRLSENTDTLMEAFLAGRMLKTGERFERAPAFDRQVLRTRDKGRQAKELVKRRLDIETSHDVPLLLEMARSRSSRDSEWALGQLARLALEGVEIDGVEVDR